MNKSILKTLSLCLVVLFLGVTACEPPAEDGENASPESAEPAQAKETDNAAAEVADKPIEAAELPDEKQRMSDLLKMEEAAAATEVTAENAEEVAAQLEAEIEADMN